ncbi:transcription elongation factor, mitochondrial [Eleutherodactylus coqui]|uniref:transcription elongation factor, mitochondrial n=1 Tax=Eleutherodactylus coqui TaxID=57060 RepID=UPI003461CEE6
MSAALRTLLNGGVRIVCRPPYCSRLMRSWETPQEGIHGEINDDGAHTDRKQQLPPNIAYWDELEPPPDIGEMYTEPSGDLTSSVAHRAIKKPGRQSMTNASFIKPDVSMGRLQAVNSIISIVFGMKRLAWAHMDRTLTVRDWQQYEWSKLVMGRHHPDLYLEAVSSAVSKFPPADIYILEKSSLTTQNASMFPVTLHLRLVEAMLYVLLNPGYATEQEHRVFSVARTTVGKHFDIMVGGSKTSGVDLVQRLVEEANTLEQPRIRFTQDLLLKYKQKLHPRGQNRNEEMCDALLQAIAFYDLTK